MPSYADLVMWVWVVALLATLVGMAMAWRALSRADEALVGVRSSDPSDALTDGARALGLEVERVAERRGDLGTRLAEPRA